MTHIESTRASRLPAPLSTLPERAYTGPGGYTGPVLARITCPDGTVYVTVDPSADVARVRVHTAQPTGPVAEAVKNTHIHQQGERLTVTVPPASGRDGDGRRFNGGVRVSGNGYSSVTTNGVTTVTNGTPGVEVDVVLPAGSGVHYTGDNGSLHIYGALAALQAAAVNGSIKAESVGRIKAEADNGSIKVDRVTEGIEAEANNGSVKVANYAGSFARVRAGNGSIVMTVDPGATGQIKATAGNGSVTLHGLAHRSDLDVQATAENGTVRKL